VLRLCLQTVLVSAQVSAAAGHLMSVPVLSAQTRCGGSLDSFLEFPLLRFGWFLGHAHEVFDEMRMRHCEALFGLISVI
jgi:hypothetical protein